jgi:hypothetical protein
VVVFEFWKKVRQVGVFLSSSASNWLLNPLLLDEVLVAPHSSLSVRCCWIWWLLGTRQFFW